MIEDFLVPNMFAVLLIFCRVGASFMLLPGLGEAYVPPNIRLLFALAFSVMLMPVLHHRLPTVPDSPATLLILLFGEILAGAVLGLVCRFMISAMHVAGMIISAHSGLTVATQFDMTQATQGTLIGNMLSLNALLMLFALDLHLVMLRGVADSYGLFQVSVMPPIGDITFYFAHFTGEIFTLGMQLAAPAIVIAVITNVAAGVLSRLMPSFQVFFIFLAPQILLAFFLLMAVYGSIMLEFTGFFSDHLGSFLAGQNVAGQ